MAVETSQEGSGRPLLRPSSRRPGRSEDAPGHSLRTSKVAQPRSVKSQKMRRPEEARGERLGSKRIQLSPASPRRGIRDSLGDSNGPPSRGLSSKSILRGKSQSESASVKGAKEAAVSPTEGSQTPGGSQHLPHDESFCPVGLPTVEPSLCPAEEKVQKVSQLSSVEAPLGAACPHKDSPPRSGLSSAGTREAILEQRNVELMRQNALLRQALLKYVSRGELLFLLAYNANGPSTAGGDGSPRDPRHTPRGSTALDDPAKESGSNRGDEEQCGRTRNIDLPCVKDFFRAMRCCPGSPDEAPLQASEGAAETAAENSGSLESLTTNTGHSGTEEPNDFTRIAVDLDPFELQKEDNQGAQTSPVEAESGPSTMSSSTTSTSRQGRFLEDCAAVALPAPSLGRSPHRPASLGALELAPAHVKARAARGSMFYPSTYRLAALLPQPPPQ